jgi:DNA-binding NarL/FixJ family response regulator
MATALWRSDGLMDLEREEVWYDQGEEGTVGIKTVALVMSGHSGWTWLRQVLGQMTGVVIVAELADAGKALEMVSALRPDIVILAGEHAVRADDELVQRLLRHSPLSSIIVVGTEQDREVLVHLGRAGAHGYLVWDELSASRLRAALAAAATGLRFATRLAANEFIAPPERRRRARQRHVELTDRERAALRGLEAGLLPHEIAQKESISLRSYERAVVSLKDKLGASTDYVLSRRVVEQGIDREL